MSQAPVIYGKYQLLERLAVGGMAEVYKAKSYGVEGFEKVLVIKRILPDLAKDPRFVELFIREAKLAVTLSHANVAQVFDLGRVDDSYFIAMEYVGGLDLRSVFRIAAKTGDPLGEGLSVYIASELAKGLDYAHRRRDSALKPLNIVHRDVSPENILISHEGEVKLTDFGVAKARQTTRALSAVPAGKLAYMAPEQARQEAVDARADLYALGAVLYEALAGVPAVGVGPPDLVLGRVRRGEVRPLSQVAEVAHELSAIVERALRPDPSERYDSAGDFYEDLIQYLYASGPRVGAQDLGEFVQRLFEAGRASPRLLDPEAQSGLEEVFQDLDGASPTSQRAATPLAIPASRPSSTPPGTPVPDAGGPGAGPRAEWRDVCVMAVSAPDPDAVRKLAARYGGTPMSGHDGGAHAPTLLLFGIGEGGGRDAHEAARCGRSLLRKAEDRRSVRVLLHQGRILLDVDLKPVRDSVLSQLRSAALRGLKEAEWGEVSASLPTSKTLRTRFELAPASGTAPRRVVRELRADEGIGRFVGRRASLRAVGEALATANKGQAGVVGIRGEAGIGKTRLLLETVRRLRHTGHDVGLYMVTCAPHTRTVPLSGVSAMLRTVLGVEEMDTDAEVRQKLARLRELGLSDGQSEAVARALGLPPAGGAPFQGTGRLRSALSRIAQKLAEDRLSVFVWDAAEFLDVTSVSVLTRTMAALPRSRVLAVLAFRSGAMARSDLLHGVREIDLGPLADEEVQRLIRTQLKVAEVPDALTREVAMKSGGNPMYVEELLWAMRDAGALTVQGDGVEFSPQKVDVELPRTLRGLISSRVGRLSASHRSILQTAVVIGAQFGVELLALAAGEDEANVRAALALLEERHIVRPLSPGHYTFEHELTREVLYESLPIDARPGLHAAVAAAIESLREADDLDALAARLAYHHRRAGHRTEALRYLVRAAERAEAEHLPEGAIDHYADAIDLINTGPAPDHDTVLRFQERIGILALATRRAEAVADRMGAAIELAEELGRDHFVARLAMTRGRLLGKAARFQEGRQWLQRAQQVARRLGDPLLQRDVALAAAEAHSLNGEYNAVIQHAEAALSLARETQDTAAQVRALLLTAPAHATLGDGERAQAALAEVQQLVGREVDRLTECELYRTRSLVAHQMGDAQGRIEAARQAMEFAKEYGFVHELCAAGHMLGDYYLRAGEDKRAFAALRSSYEAASEQGLARWIWINACLLGYLDAMRFEAGQGRVRMLQAIRYAEQRGYTWDLLGEKYLFARVEQQRGDADSARRYLRSVMELAERHGHRRLADDAESGLRALEVGEPIPLPR